APGADRAGAVQRADPSGPRLPGRSRQAPPLPGAPARVPRADRGVTHDRLRATRAAGEATHSRAPRARITRLRAGNPDTSPTRNRVNTAFSVQAQPPIECISRSGL